MIATANGAQFSDKIATDGWSSDVPSCVRFLYAGLRAVIHIDRDGPNTILHLDKPASVVDNEGVFDGR